MPHTVLAPNAPVMVVCIDHHPRNALLIRRAYKRAEKIGAQLYVVYVETPAHFKLLDSEKETLLQNIRLAQKMGAEFYQLTSSDVASAILDFVKEKNAQYLVIGHSRRWKWGVWKQTTLVDKVLKSMSEVEVHTIPLGDEEGRVRKKILRSIKLQPIDYIKAALSVVVAYILTEIIRYTTGSIVFNITVYNISMLFVLACVFSALRYGLGPGMLSSTLSFLAINYFYIRPIKQLSVAPQDITNFVLFIVATLIAAIFGGHSRKQSEAIRKREQLAQTLYRLSKTIAYARDTKDVLAILNQELNKVLNGKTAFFMSDMTAEKNLNLIIPKDIKLPNSSQDALDYAWKSAQPTGYGTRLFSVSRWRFEPMVTPRGAIGILGVHISHHHNQDDPSYFMALQAMADQAAIAIERVVLSMRIEEVRINEEREKLRANLLSSVSHDLKTPLASIIGSLSAIHHLHANLSDEARKTLLETALEEAERLNRFITNILDMTRLESGGVQFNKSWHEPDELIARVLKRLKHRLINHTVIHHVLNPQIEVEIDGTLIEQVVQNLLDNAVKYSPVHSTITISSAMVEKNGELFWKLHIRDEGYGIPQEERQRIFDKYARLSQRDKQIAGTGLGLAICKAIVEEHGGTITIEDNTLAPQGTVFTLIFPSVKLLDTLMVTIG